MYERAIANVPPIQEKRHWKRYIYLWINYALYEELEAKASSNSKSFSFPGIFLTLNSYRYVNTKKSFVSFATLFAI